MDESKQRVIKGEDKHEVHLIEELDESSVRITQYAIGNSGLVKHAGANLAVDTKPSLSERSAQAWRYLLGVFLPAGYPQSVTEDYINYQIYDSLQAFCSSIAGLLSSRAVLSSVGVGDSSASPTNALLLSVLQESTGRVATILFAHRLGTHLEPECKAWRLAADVFNDAGMVLDCLSPAFPRGVRTVVLSLSSTLRALCGVAAGSAKASLSAHFARRGGNLGEVNAKDSSQETVVSLVGMLAGTLVVSRVTSTAATWAAMLLLLALHLAMNYAAVAAVSLTTLNRQRANIVFSNLFAKSSSSAGDDGKVRARRALPPQKVSQRERIFAANGALVMFATDDYYSGPKRVGYAEVGLPLSRFVTEMGESAGDIGRLVDVFKREKFLLWSRHGDDTRAFICLKDDATAKDIVKAWAMALYTAGYRTETSEDLEDAGKHVEALAEDLAWLNERWEDYVMLLEHRGWDLTIGSIETGKASRLRFRKNE